MLPVVRAAHNSAAPQQRAAQDRKALFEPTHDASIERRVSWLAGVAASPEPDQLDQPTAGPAIPIRPGPSDAVNLKVRYGAICIPCSRISPSGTCWNPVSACFIPTMFLPIHR